MRATYLRGILAVVAVAAAMGCIRRGKSADTLPADIQPITIARVTNNNWLDVGLYAVRGGSRERLGIVRSFETQAFELPPQFLAASGLRLYVDLIGSRQSYQTDRIPVSPGQLIELVVQQRLAQSHYSVFNP
jgi:hypothetical protein